MAQIIDENGLKYNFRFIVVEGPDGVGKSTIVTKICQAMMGNGVPYIKTHFPNHNIAPLDKDGTCWTVKSSVKQFLDGEVNIRYNPDAIAHLYTHDRLMTWFGENYQWETTDCLRNRVLKMCKDYPHTKAAPVLISDRYTQSSVVYQSVDRVQSDWDSWREELESYEYNILKLPKPDKVIYLDAPVEGIIENIKLRGNEPDTFESDNQFLADVCVAGRYHALYGNWASYEVMDRLGHFDPDIPDQICRDLGYYPDEERL